MNTMIRLTATVTLALVLAAAGSGMVRAESDDAHHPDEATAPAATPVPGMMGNGGMMGGDGMMPMMRMMQMMSGGMAGQGMGGSMGMMRFDHIEGRIAFLRTELGITDAQQPQWTAFADALRAQAGTMRTMGPAMMQGGMPATWPERLARHEQRLTAHLAALKAIAGPARALYAVLSPAQRLMADELMARPMGGMMGGM